jgi:hypothetical protein
VCVCACVCVGGVGGGGGRGGKVLNFFSCKPWKKSFSNSQKSVCLHM